jgi:pyruvate/2-oxoglutarate dehydrogenase complex dihydrolipoamide dehydrogenase (E3) component
MTRARRKLLLASRLKKACSRGQHPGAIANGRDEGVTKLLFDDSPEAHGHGKILGGGMVGTHAV